MRKYLSSLCPAGFDAIAASVRVCYSAFKLINSTGRNSRIKPEWAEFFKSEQGMEVVEWLLVLGGVIVPLAAFIYKIMDMVARFYSFNSWITSLPFP
jgi:hypothetical protein